MRGDILVAKESNEMTTEKKEKKDRIFEFKKYEIIKRRLQLLNVLQGAVEKGDLKAIELFNKILTDLRGDMEEEDSNDWFEVLEELISDE